MNFNSDIDISLFKNIDSDTIKQIRHEFYQKYTTLPEEFNWAYVIPGDSEEMKFKKKLISEPKNQYLCGSCWAISCATAISDAFVIKSLVNWAPNVSYTYALSNYPQKKCAGGSSRVLLEDIKNGHGIASDFCVDESWCLSNKECITSDSSEHFVKGDKDYLSSLIPNKGCYNSQSNHYVYKLQDVYSLTVCENLKIFEAQLLIKQHIMIRGPVVGGFLIMDNFPSGEFVNQDTGIYFEKDEHDSILGSHSVVIIGWGISNGQINDVNVKIPYWFCRNSWGKNWGDHGYFKIAMYPYNKISQFTKQIKIIHKGIVIQVGGVTGFNVTERPRLMRMRSNNAKINFYKNHTHLYSIDENLIHKDMFPLMENNDNKIIIYLTFISLCFLFIKNYFKMSV